MKNNQNKKMIMPVVIVVLIVVFTIVNVIMPILFLGLSLLLRAVFFVATIAVIVIAIHVLRERIKEIRSGQEDDLGKY